MSQEDHITQLQELVAHLTRTVEDLSDVIARQDLDIERLKGRVQLLVQREAQREAEDGNSIPLADQRPPHW